MPERVIAGRYRLLSVLGRGGMGTVWRARDEVLRRSVAVKEVSFPPGVSAQERELLTERTLREARLAARVSAPGAVRVYDVVEDDGRPCIVMELVEGRTLSDVIRDDGPLSPQRTAQIGVSVAEALAAAHEAGVIHRDVKPSNVILQPGGRATLTDFGIARGNDDASLTSTGLLVGSPAYISPERVRGRPPQPASDIWSLGATLFTAVEGRAPYEGGDPIATMTAVATGPHAPFVAAGPLAPVLDRMLARRPENRPGTGEAADLLRSVAAGTARPAPGEASTAVLPATPAGPAELDESELTWALTSGPARTTAAGEPAAQESAEQQSAGQEPAERRRAPAPPVRRPAATRPSGVVGQPGRPGSHLGWLAGALALLAVAIIAVALLRSAGSTSAPGTVPSTGVSTPAAPTTPGPTSARPTPSATRASGTTGASPSSSRTSSPSSAAPTAPTTAATAPTTPPPTTAGTSAPTTAATTAAGTGSPTS